MCACLSRASGDVLLEGNAADADGGHDSESNGAGLHAWVAHVVRLSGAPQGAVGKHLLVVQTVPERERERKGRVERGA